MLTNAALARRSRATWIVWAGAALEVALIQVWHGSPTAIAACSAAALVPTLLVVGATEVRAWTRRPAQNPPEPAEMSAVVASLT